MYKATVELEEEQKEYEGENTTELINKIYEENDYKKVKTLKLVRVKENNVKDKR